MPQPFRFSVVIANSPSPTAFVTLARRAEELGYATLFMPDRTITGLPVLSASTATAFTLLSRLELLTVLPGAGRLLLYDRREMR